MDTKNYIRNSMEVQFLGPMEQCPWCEVFRGQYHSILCRIRKQCLEEAVAGVFEVSGGSKPPGDGT